MMKHGWCISCLFVCCVSISFCEVRKYANDFLEIGVSARNLAMGKSGIMSSAGPWSLYWNPSLIPRYNGDFMVGYMHAIYMGGIAQYDYLGISKKFDTVGGLSVGFLRIGIDDIPNTLEFMDETGGLHWDKISYFSASDNALLIGYATVWRNLTVGFTGKFIYRKVGKWAQAYGFGIDISSTFSHNDILIGLVIRDITTTNTLWVYTPDQAMINAFQMTGNELPERSTETSLPSVRVAVSKRMNLGKNFSAVPEIVATSYTDGMRNAFITSKVVSIDVNGGLELSYRNIVFVRWGFYNVQKVRAFMGNYHRTTATLTGGIGIKIGKLNIDYSYLNLGGVSPLPYSHVFSASLTIEKPQK